MKHNCHIQQKRYIQAYRNRFKLSAETGGREALNHIPLGHLFSSLYLDQERLHR